MTSCWRRDGPRRPRRRPVAGSARGSRARPARRAPPAAARRRPADRRRTGSRPWHRPARRGRGGSASRAGRSACTAPPRTRSQRHRRGGGQLAQRDRHALRAAPVDERRPARAHRRQAIGSASRSVASATSAAGRGPSVISIVAAVPAAANARACSTCSGRNTTAIAGAPRQAASSSEWPKPQTTSAARATAPPLGGRPSRRPCRPLATVAGPARHFEVDPGARQRGGQRHREARGVASADAEQDAGPRSWVAAGLGDLRAHERVLEAVQAPAAGGRPPRRGRRIDDEFGEHPARPTIVEQDDAPSGPCNARTVASEVGSRRSSSTTGACPAPPVRAPRSRTNASASGPTGAKAAPARGSRRSRGSARGVRSRRRARRRRRSRPEPAWRPPSRPSLPSSDERDGHGCGRVHRVAPVRGAARRGHSVAASTTSRRPIRARPRSSTWPARPPRAFTFHEADLGDAPLAELLEGVDSVFHLAARPGVRDSWAGSTTTCARTSPGPRRCSMPASGATCARLRLLVERLRQRRRSCR